MPAKNVIRHYAPDSYYHIYNRGVEKRAIFLDEQDYLVFINLLRRYLSPKSKHDLYGRLFENYSKDLELLAFCLMPNHFHLLVYQHGDGEAFSKLLRRVASSYTVYFNKRYERVGHLFQANFKASRVDDERYLHHISRYIHLNPKDYKAYRWSSLPYYASKQEPDWIKPGRILELFKNSADYLWFIDDHKDHQISLKAIKSTLANY